MPLGAPIGSGLGIQNITNLRILRERGSPRSSLIGMRVWEQLQMLRFAMESEPMAS